MQFSIVGVYFYISAKFVEKFLLQFYKKYNKIQTQEEFNTKMNTYKANLNKYFNENKLLEDEINKSLEELKYEY